MQQGLISWISSQSAVGVRRKVVRKRWEIRLRFSMCHFGLYIFRLALSRTTTEDEIHETRSDLINCKHACWVRYCVHAVNHFRFLFEHVMWFEENEIESLNKIWTVFNFSLLSELSSIFCEIVYCCTIQNWNLISSFYFFFFLWKCKLYKRVIKTTPEIVLANSNYA